MTNNDIPLNQLTAISPLDGRYRDKTKELAEYVSEYALISTRFEIEAKYLVALSDIKVIRNLTAKEKTKLNLLGSKITLADAVMVKKIEEETRHDVKALERAFRQMVKGTSLADITEMIHFGLTSEDVNNLAYRLMLRRATDNVCVLILDELIDQLTERAQKYLSIPMLARTHGQAAVPTTVGKELAVFATRLNWQVLKLKEYQLTGKLTGAVGNFNALQLTHSTVDWLKFSQEFIKQFSFKPNLVTTQINPYEDIIEFFQIYTRINSIIIDFAQDIWRYISDDWFVQEVKKGEIGSSTMPQKVNPIDFENAEGNLTLANGILETLCRKLSISRLQRDLTDSTTIRNIGSVLGYSLIGYKSILSGLARIRPNVEKLEIDLNRDWSILAEAVQTLLRKAKVSDPYSLISSLTRGEHINEEKWQKWIRSLPIKNDLKSTLAKLMPSTYIGLAEEITKRAAKEIKASRHK